MNTTLPGLNVGIISRDLYHRSIDTNRKQQHCDVFSPDSVLPSEKELPASNKTIVCFHGSPGCKEDFCDLKKLIPDISLHAYPRKNYPGFSNTFLDCIAQRENQVLTGYSWGCRDLLEYYAKNNSNIAMIILISPYILNSSKSALSTKSRLIAGLLKKILMKIENRISDNNRNTCNCSDSDKHSLLNKSLLYICGLCEKTEHQVISYASILRLVAELDTPVHIIAGTSDTTIHCQQSQELIKTINRNVFYHYINGGNHDILKTHVHQIARIFKLIIQRSS
ncbi:MAG: alpha/beta hydrolase [Fibrobacter sp.]|nr:alpha/beta hydrolase [Fibrobacter sp.]